MEVLKPINWNEVPAGIPKIPRTKKRLVNLYAQSIKPLILGEDGIVHHCVADCNHFDESYPWVAKATVPADLKEIDRIWTLHRYGHYSLFKPSVAEVLMQIPENLLDNVDFFLVRGPDTSDDLNATKESFLRKEVHVAETILYQKLDRKEEVGEYLE